LFWVVAALLVATYGAAPAPPRIVSLIPSFTEDLFAVGAGTQVVGTSQFSDYPPAAKRVPQISTFASVDAERIVALHPDVVVGIPAQASMVRDLRRAGLRVVLMSDDSYDDIFANLNALGHLSGHAKEASALVARLRAETTRLVAPVKGATRPRCFVVLGVAPIFTAGDRSYIAQLIALAGGRNAANDLPLAYGRYSAETLVAKQPDLLISDDQSGLGSALGRSPWKALRAVRDRRVYILDDAAILERPGPRYNQGLAWLVAHLHPAPQGKTVMRGGSPARGAAPPKPKPSPR
jgi:ABC-type Fe3+-hydroxamate transport system substrate-binding protein